MTKEQVATNTIDERQGRLYRQVLSWLLVPVSAIIGLGAVWILNSKYVSPEFRGLLLQHFAALIGLPGAALAALFDAVGASGTYVIRFTFTTTACP